MTIIIRFNRLFKADMHGILDCLEDPEAVISQAVRDMKEIIEQEKTEHQALSEKAKMVADAIHSKEEKIAEFESQISLCFEEGNEELAKHFVRKKLEGFAVKKVLEAELEGAERRKQALNQQIAEHSNELERICEKQELFSKRRAHCSDSVATSADDTLIVSEEAVEVAFLQEKRRFDNADVSA